VAFQEKDSATTPASSGGVVCYECNGTGHFGKDCPNRRNKRPRKPEVNAAVISEGEETDGYTSSEESRRNDPSHPSETEPEENDSSDVSDTEFSPSSAIHAAIVDHDQLEADMETIASTRTLPLELYLTRSFDSQSEFSDNVEFATFLHQYDAKPTDKAPSVLRYDDAILVAPSDKQSLQAFLYSTESVQACQGILTPYLDKLRKRGVPRFWTWQHALEFLLLNKLIRESALSIHDAELPSARHNELVISERESNDFMRSMANATVVRPLIPLKNAAVARPPVLEIFLNGKPALLTVDSAASASLITLKTLNKYHPNARLTAPNVPMLSAFGSELRPVGTYSMEIVLKHPKHPLRLRVSFLVLDTGTVPTPLLLGINYYNAYGMVLDASNPSLTVIRVRHYTQTFPSVSDKATRAIIQAIETPSSPSQGGRVTPEPREFNIALSETDLNTALTEPQLLALRQLIRSYPMAFAHGSHQLGNHNKHSMVIQLEMPEPMPAHLRKNPYPSSLQAKKDVNDTIDELIRWKIIRPSKSPFSAPAVMIYRHGKPHMVVDYRALNTYMIPDRYPLPRIQESLVQLSGARFISVLDANKGFHQVSIAPECQHYTAFATHHGLFEYSRMPFGLKNAPAIFQRAMDDIFHAELRTGWLRVYIDDILVYSASKHLEHLKVVFSKIEAAGFTLSLKKCRFAYPELHALGHKVSGLQITISDNHLAAIRDWPKPTDKKAVQRFVSFAIYHLGQVKRLAISLAPLTNLTKASTPFHWSETHDAAFARVKKDIMSTVALTQCRTDLPFLLYVDASIGTPLEPGGLGASLTQFQDGKEVVICFISRQLRNAETRYGPTQLECLAVIWALEKCHYYLDGAIFTIICDCKALKALLGMKTPNRHMLRWQLFIQHYHGQMTIVHRSGASHVNADGLSRAALANDSANPAADLHDDDIPEIHFATHNLVPEIHAVSIVNLSEEFFDKIRDGYKEDEPLRLIVDTLSAPNASKSPLLGSLPAPLKTLWDQGRFFLADDLLYKRSGLHSALVIGDKATRTSVLASSHDEPSVVISLRKRLWS
jgi:hypothetical protein